MVAHLLRLRLLSIANAVRFGLRAAASSIVTVLVVLVAAIVVAVAISTLRDAPLAETRALVVGGGSLLLVIFFVAPFASSRPAWADPRRLAGFPVTTDTAAGGLALAGAIGLPALALIVLATGYVRSWDSGPGLAWLAVLAAVIAGTTAILLALVASSLDSVISGHRSRRLLVVGGVVIAVLLIPLVVDLVRVLMPGGYGGSAALADALAWTPFGAALALPGHAAVGAGGRVVADVLVAAATLAVLWWAWRSLVYRALNRPEAPDAAEGRPGLGWFDVVLGRPAGVVAARSLTYWVRDSRYRWSLVILPFLPLLVVPLGIAGVDWASLALVPLPVMCLVLGFLPHNDVAYDNTALWMHVASNTRGFADRAGRLAPPLVIGIPLAVVGSLVAVWLHGDFAAFGAELGLSLSLLLCGLGLSSITSAALPYAAVRPGGDPFQQPQSTGAAAGWAQSILFGGSLVLSVPTGWLAIRATIGGESDLATTALLAGVVTGVVVLVVGVLLGSAVFSRRAPELMAFALRS